MRSSITSKGWGRSGEGGGEGICIAEKLTPQPLFARVKLMSVLIAASYN